MLARFAALLARPVDGASLAFFRIAFGLGMCGEAWSLLKPRPGGSFLTRIYTGPDVHWFLPYPWFTWLPTFSPAVITGMVWALAAAGLCLAVGAAMRLAALVCLAIWSYLWVVDATLFNNHYYLWSLLALLLVFMPAGRCWSVDRWVRDRRRPGPLPEADEIPFWPLFLLRTQLFIMYFYAAITKITVDYLWHAEPLKTALTSSEVLRPFRNILPAALLRPVADLLHWPTLAYAMAYSGLTFDLVIGVLLIVRRTRILGLALTGFFHGFNHLVLFEDIGWFPILGLLSTLIFLDADWPRRLLAWLRRPTWRAPEWRWFAAGAALLPVFGAALGWKLRDRPPESPSPARRLWLGTVPAVLLWTTFHIVWPLRHWLIPGNVNWTTEGERLSWRMKANSRLGWPTLYRVVDPAVAGPGRNGRLRVDWNAWKGPREIYHDVSFDGIRWSSLPEVLPVVQPLVGERILYNPLAASVQVRGDAVAHQQRLEAWWQGRFGRRPVVQATISLIELFDRAEAVFRRQRVDSVLLDAVRAGRELAQKMADPETKSAPRRRLSLQLTALMGQLSRSTTVGGTVRQFLQQLDPWALEGIAAPPGAGFLAVEDRKLLEMDDRGYVRLNRERWRAAATDEALEWWADFRELPAADWKRLPAWMAYEASGRMCGVLCNPYRDLAEFRCQRIAMRPLMMHTYAQRVAERWQADYGRRPQVYVWADLAINQHPPQTIVDPTVDLAAAPLGQFRHNPWILPRKRYEALP